MGVAGVGGACSEGVAGTAGFSASASLHKIQYQCKACHDSLVKCGHNGPYGPDGWFRVGTVIGTFYMRYFIIFQNLITLE